MDIVAPLPPSGMCFWLVTLGAAKKNDQVKKKSQHRNGLRLTFAGRVRPKLNNVPCFGDACRERVHEPAPWVAVCGYWQPKAIAWHAFVTFHARSKRKTNERAKEKKGEHCNGLHLTFADRLPPELNKVLCCWDACRGRTYDLTRLASVCGCCWPKTSL